MKDRRKNLIKYAQKAGCDCIITFEPENLFYLTGFWGEAIGVLEKNGRTTIIAPELEADRARSESTDTHIATSERGASMITDLVKMTRGTKPCTDCQNYTIMSNLKKSIPKIIHSTEPFENARIIKDAAEVSILKKASCIIDEMFGLCTKQIKKGTKESELQASLMSYALSRGMSDTGYKSTLHPLIIAGGPNGALPHAQVTDRKFKDGDLIVVDLTLRYRGYVSDATRTFGLGRVSHTARHVYDLVKESQRLGLCAVKPNVKCKSIDDACRNYLNDTEYGKYFIHSTGHGIGLDVHELPTISYKSNSKLYKNMAITVEPGIYIPNKFGIRIEDSLIVDKKPYIMHKFTKDLLVL